MSNLFGAIEYNSPTGLPNYRNLVGLNPGTPAFGRPNQGELVLFAPTRYLKFEYDNSLNSSTFLSAKYYNWENLQGSSNNEGFSGANPSNLGIGAYPTWNQTGGPKVGARLDLTHQFSSKHTVTLDGLYENAHPIWDGYDPNAMVFLLAATGHYGDFLPGGYLSQYFPNGIPRIPNTGIGYNGAFFQNFGYGIREQWAPNDRLKADLGVRFDGQNQHYGFNPFNPTEPGNPSDVNPSTITPKSIAPSENRFAGMWNRFIRMNTDARAIGMVAATISATARRRLARTSRSAAMSDAITGVPHAMASIITRPKGSRHAIGNNRPAALPRNSLF